MDNKLFVPNKDGFFDELVVMLVSMSSYMFTMHVSMASNTPVPFGERPLKEWISYIAPLKIIDWPLTLGCRATESNLVIFPIPVVMICSLDGWPQYIEYRIEPIVKTQPSYRLSGDSVTRVMSGIVGSSFSNFYERCKPIIEKRYGNSVDLWPETSRFAWALRNGFVHGGSLRINNPKLRPISWKIWTIDSTYNGRECLHKEGMLGIGDVILLMQELDDLTKSIMS